MTVADGRDRRCPGLPPLHTQMCRSLLKLALATREVQQAAACGGQPVTSPPPGGPDHVAQVRLASCTTLARAPIQLVRLAASVPMRLFLCVSFIRAYSAISMQLWCLT